MPDNTLTVDELHGAIHMLEPTSTVQIVDENGAVVHKVTTLYVNPETNVLSVAFNSSKVSA